MAQTPAPVSTIAERKVARLVVSSDDEDSPISRRPPSSGIPYSHIMLVEKPPRRSSAAGGGPVTRIADRDTTMSTTRLPETATATSRQLQNIKCLYTDNVNIGKVATDVIAHLRRLAGPAEVEHIRRLIIEKKAELEDGLWTLTQFNRRTAEIAKLEKESAGLSTLEESYRTAIAPIVQRWSLCTRTPDVCFLSEIDECICAFARATSVFVPMSAIKVQSSADDLCFVCGRVDTLVDTPGSSGQLYCKICKAGRQVLSASNARDTKGGDDSSAGEDDATETDRIELILKRFQGKQPPLSREILDKIESYLNSRSVLKQSEIRELIIKDPANRQGTSKALLEEAMRATHNERAYKDQNSVCSTLWGWELPVLTQDFEALIIADYRLTQAFYPIVRGERRSRLNADYRLMRHLLTRGFWHPILDDLRSASTLEVQDYNEMAWSRLCSLAGLPLVPMRV